MLPKDIVKELQSNPENVLRELYILYRNEFLNWFINYSDCSTEDAQDMFSECLLIVHENVVTGKLISLTSSMKTYIYAIAKNKRKESYRKQKKILTINNEIIASNEEEDNKEEQLDYIEKAFEILGEPCKTILEYYYYQEKSYSDIATELSYKNIGSIKSMKYRCLERLKGMVLQKLENNNSYVIGCK